MSDAPERIWLGVQGGEGLAVECWSASCDLNPDDGLGWVEGPTEYVRADLLDAEVLRLRAALEKIGKTYQCDGNRLIHGTHDIINIVQAALEQNKAKP